MLRKCIKCKEVEIAYEESDFCQECGDFMFEVAVAEMRGIGHELRFQEFRNKQLSRTRIVEQSNDKILLNA